MGDRLVRRAFGRQSPLRSFALGGLLGAAGTIATVRRLRRPVEEGLGAFESAPCFSASRVELPREANSSSSVSSPE